MFGHDDPGGVGQATGFQPPPQQGAPNLFGDGHQGIGGSQVPLPNDPHRRLWALASRPQTMNQSMSPTTRAADRFGGMHSYSSGGAMGANVNTPVNPALANGGVNSGQGPDMNAVQQARQQGPDMAAIQAEMARRQVGQQLGPRNAALSGYMMG